MQGPRAELQPSGTFCWLRGKIPGLKICSQSRTIRSTSAIWTWSKKLVSLCRLDCRETQRSLGKETVSLAALGKEGHACASVEDLEADIRCLLAVHARRESANSGVSPSSYKGTSPIGLGLILITTFNLNYLPNSSISKHGHPGDRASTYGFLGGGIIQSTTVLIISSLDCYSSLLILIPNFLHQSFLNMQPDSSQ